MHSLEEPTPLQDRARLRAVGGDLVAAVVPPLDEYEDYCRTWLGLGSVRWLYPAVTRIATECRDGLLGGPRRPPGTHPRLTYG